MHLKSWTSISSTDVPVFRLFPWCNQVPGVPITVGKGGVMRKQRRWLDALCSALGRATRGRSRAEWGGYTCASKSPPFPSRCSNCVSARGAQTLPHHSSTCYTQILFVPILDDLLCFISCKLLFQFLHPSLKGWAVCACSFLLHRVMLTDQKEKPPHLRLTELLLHLEEPSITSINGSQPTQTEDTRVGNATKTRTAPADHPVLGACGVSKATDTWKELWSTPLFFEGRIRLRRG